jgi:hypothetical protein
MAAHFARIEEELTGLWRICVRFDHMLAYLITAEEEEKRWSR